MELNEIVISYITKEGDKVNVDLKSLSEDDNFRGSAISAILQQISGNGETCIYFPSFGKENKNLGKLINELAVYPTVRNLMTGKIENLKRKRGAGKKNVVLIKQAFLTGKTLAAQVATLKKMGYKVSVLCLVAHSRAKLEEFGKNKHIEIEALVHLDEL